jgi:TetR/AcrR family transcriptional repressor of nem operon
MPRVSREQTVANREAIEHVSARLFREQGINGVSVADLMGAAGLTHGGFYGHFASKDDLAAVACAHAFGQSAERRIRWCKGAPGAASAMQEMVDRYVSLRHRDGVGEGCPAVALAADVAREAPHKPVRAAYLAGIKNMAAGIEALCPEAPVPRRRETALARMATMVGALLLARATSGDPISAEILAAARMALAPDVVPADAAVPGPTSRRTHTPRKRPA